MAEGRTIILSKTVHTSELQWGRLVMPQAQAPYWRHMQEELGLSGGKDFEFYVRDVEGGATRQLGAKISVQRPMLMGLRAYYTQHQVLPGDLLTIYRCALTSELTLGVEHGPGGVHTTYRPAYPKCPALEALGSSGPHAAAAAAATAPPAVAAGQGQHLRPVCVSSRALHCGAGGVAVSDDEDEMDTTPTLARAEERPGVWGQPPRGHSKRSLQRAPAGEADDEFESDGTAELFRGRSGRLMHRVRYDSWAGSGESDGDEREAVCSDEYGCSVDTMKLDVLADVAAGCLWGK